MERNPVYDLPAQEYNLKLADALKQLPEFEIPEWIHYVKSGPAKERPIDDLDFWHKRAASILRQVYKRELLGVSRLRTRYGSKKNRGNKPEKFVKAGGKIIRTILQQSDRAGLTEMSKIVKGIRNKKPGRKLTAKGKAFMEGIK